MSLGAKDVQAVRLKNLIGEDQMPTAMITGPMIDETMSTKKTLERALELLDIEQFERDRSRYLLYE